MEQDEDRIEDDLDAREISSFNQHWGWLGTIFQLANEDITKTEKITTYPLVYVLNYMAYMQDVSRLRDKENKKVLQSIKRF